MQSPNQISLTKINNKPFKANFDPVFAGIKINQPQAISNKELKQKQKKRVLFINALGILSCLSIIGYYTIYKNTNEEQKSYLPPSLKVSQVINSGLENKVNTTSPLPGMKTQPSFMETTKSAAIKPSVITPYKLPAKPAVVASVKTKAKKNITKPVNHSVNKVSENKTVSVKVAPVPYNQKIEKLSNYIAKGYKVSDNKALTIVTNAFHISEKKGIDPVVLLAITAVESSFNEKARNSSGAVGLVQAMPKAHPEKIRKIKSNGGSVYNIKDNLTLGAQIYKEYLISSGGNKTLALQRYNGSLGDKNRTYSKKVYAAMKPMKNIVGHH